ncbi:MAG TPA: class I SAM-dependent methyltransferase [Streptosporangiaceae bacterium]|nr:class I SAM-dependent methyltransferase [Streptosporangiaceae bacterium]
MAAESRRDGVRSSLLWDVLREVASARAAETGRTALDIVDVGGGTGGLAVPFASLGHNVTVVDPSPDALAAAQRRAAEAGACLAAVQGEAASLDSVAGVAAADLIICHNVLEYVDSPADAMTAIATVLRPGATVSVLAANAVAAVLHRALAGRFAEALLLIRGDDPPGPPDLGAKPFPPNLPGPPPAGGLAAPQGRRYTLDGLTALIDGAGLRVGQVHGVRIFSGLVPAAVVDGDPGSADALRALEAAAAATPPLRDIAAQLHILGHR